MLIPIDSLTSCQSQILELGAFYAFRLSWKRNRSILTNKPRIGLICYTIYFLNFLIAWKRTSDTSRGGWKGKLLFSSRLLIISCLKTFQLLARFSTQKRGVHRSAAVRPWTGTSFPALPLTLPLPSGGSRTPKWNYGALAVCQRSSPGVTVLIR